MVFRNQIKNQKAKIKNAFPLVDDPEAPLGGEDNQPFAPVPLLHHF